MDPITVVATPYGTGCKRSPSTCSRGIAATQAAPSCPEAAWAGVDRSSSDQHMLPLAQTPENLRVYLALLEAARQKACVDVQVPAAGDLVLRDPGGNGRFVNAQHSFDVRASAERGHGVFDCRDDAHSPRLRLDLSMGCGLGGGNLGHDVLLWVLAGVRPSCSVSCTARGPM